MASAATPGWRCGRLGPAPKNRLRAGETRCCVVAAPATLPRELETADELSDEYADEAEEIVVTGRRQRGAVLGDIPPELQLDARDIRAVGASDIAGLLEAIAAQMRSGRGRVEGGP